ncbi:MAG: immunoglobulin domain-containing protein [Ignavibacteriales bacterium]|nr:immunoglobulin domain-containing protein [Ignavibacteriales bacterium]
MTNKIFAVLLFQVLSLSTILAQETGTVTDIDGNVYNTIKIGDQWWMAENLKVTHYNDGTEIPIVEENSSWANLTTPGYCWYYNNISYKESFGALYNWFTVNKGNVCPAHWHVPTNEDWDELTEFVGGSLVAGGKLKEVGYSYWTCPNNVGATNEYNFNAKPVGLRYRDGSFSKTGWYYHLWSSDNADTELACQRDIGCAYQGIGCANSYKTNGFAIRCIEGDEPVNDFEIIVQPEGQSVKEGDFVSFEIEASGNDISYQWQKNGVDLVESNRVSGITSNDLIISNIQLSDEGNYNCVVSNEKGSITTNVAKLEVLADVEVPSIFYGFPEMYNEFTLFDTLYRVRQYLSNIPLLKNTDEEITAIVPIITYIPDQNKPNEEYAINDKYKHGMLLNYVYYKYGFCDTRLTASLNDSYWDKQAEIMVELGDVYKPWKALGINGTFALSQVLSTIGWSILIPNSAPAQLKNVYTVLKGVKIGLKLGEETIDFLENVSSRPDDNTMSHVMSAQANISRDFYIKYSQNSTDYNYIKNGFHILGNTPILIKGSIFAYENYPILLKSARYFEEFTISPATEFGQMSLRNGADILHKSLLDGGIYVEVGTELAGIAFEKLVYKGIDEIGSMATDLIYMGNIHAGTLEAYAYMLDNRKKDLDYLNSYANLMELDSAVSIYRYTSGKYFEILSALTQNNYSMGKAIHNVGLKGKIAISKSDLKSSETIMKQHGEVYSQIIDDLLEFQSVSEYLYQNYPKFGDITTLKTARTNLKSTSESINVSIENVYIDDFGSFYSNDTIIVNCEISNFGSLVENNIIIDIYDNGINIGSLEVDSVKFLEINNLAYSYVAQEGERKITFKVQNTNNIANVKEKSILLYINEIPNLNNPYVDSSEYGYRFSIQYNSPSNISPENNCIYLSLNDTTILLSTSDNNFSNGSNFVSDIIEIDENISFYYSVLVDGKWYRHPKIGEFKLMPYDTTEIETFDIISPSLNDSVSYQTENIKFQWESLKNEINSISYHMQLADNPLFNVANNYNDISDTSITIPNSLNANKIYYWRVFATSSTDTIYCNQIAEFVVEKSIDIDINSEYTICTGASLNLSLNDSYETVQINDSTIYDSIILKEKGMYQINVEDEFGHIAIDSFNLVLNPLPILDLGNYISITENDSITIGVDDIYESYLWNTNDTSNIMQINRPATGSYEYWIKVTDYNTCSNSDTVTLFVTPYVNTVNLSLTHTISIYPNPSNDYLYIEAVNFGNSNFNIEIYNIKGQLIKTIERDIIKKEILEIDISDLEQGVYLYKMHINEYKFNGKIVKKG